jgi:hypothetical protein
MYYFLTEEGWSSMQSHISNYPSFYLLLNIRKEKEAAKKTI